MATSALCQILAQLSRKARGQRGLYANIWHEARVAML